MIMSSWLWTLGLDSCFSCEIVYCTELVNENATASIGLEKVYNTVPIGGLEEYIAM